MLGERLKLISHALCPYVQRAAITLEEKGVDYERENIDLENPPEWFSELSPQGKVPLLLVNSKDVLFESSVICEFLDEITEGSLHDSLPLNKAKHRAWMEYGSSILVDIWNYYNAENKDKFLANGEAIKKKLQRLETELKQQNWQGPFFNGADYCMVDAVYAPVFRYFDVFEKFTDDRLTDSVERVSSWRQQLASRKSTKAVVSASYSDLLIDFVISRQSYLGGIMQDLSK